MEETKKEVTIRVQMKTPYMFEFLYWHSYHGFYGVLNYGFSLAALAALLFGFGKDDTIATVALIILACLFTVINPLLLLRKAAKQVKRVPMFQKPIEYTFDEKGFTVMQEAESAQAAWGDVVLVRETKNILALYLGAANAIVLPKAAGREEVAEIKKLLLKAQPAFERSLKK